MVGGIVYKRSILVVVLCFISISANGMSNKNRKRPRPKYLNNSQPLVKKETREVYEKKRRAYINMVEETCLKKYCKCIEKEINEHLNIEMATNENLNIEMAIKEHFKKISKRFIFEN